MCALCPIKTVRFLVFSRNLKLLNVYETYNMGHASSSYTVINCVNTGSFRRWYLLRDFLRFCGSLIFVKQMIGDTGLIILLSCYVHMHLYGIYQFSILVVQHHLEPAKIIMLISFFFCHSTVVIFCLIAKTHQVLRFIE